jgi:phosphate acetyltransferase
MDAIIAQAKSNPQRIVLPEGTEERTIKAADILIEKEIAKITLLGNKAEIERLVAKFGLKNIDKATIIDPENYPESQKYADLLFQLRKEKGMSFEEAVQYAQNPMYLGCLLIKNGDADGEVSGAGSYTREVLRPALEIIKTKPGVDRASGAFLMILKDKTCGYNGKLLFADCAVTPDPTAEQLGQIAVCSGRTAKNIYGFPEPRIAILSFSTKGSARHKVVNKVIEATRIAQELAPDLKIDGELQADAAIDALVAKSKAPGSEVAGSANVLVFASLNVGNIAYILVQRLAHAEAIGPLLQGLQAPVNDLSRGCSVEDIVNLVAITAVQAIEAKAE